ncbi:MAG: hypothetical protein HY847_10480 [Betaproteobacteria bacterium]|nr:hypothetical protein [Betaproteobacteria bacterium]
MLQAWGGATLLGGTGIAGLIATALANDAAAAIQGIRRLSGAVTLNGVAAQAGMPVRQGDRIVTGANSEVVYVIGQDAYLQRGQTSVSFADNAAGILRVISGKLLSVFGKGERNLVTPTATIGIRGTACYIEAEAERVYFCLCYGEADLVPTAAPAERELIRTTHHDHPLYIHNDMQMPKMMVPAGVINHTDAELILLESLVGRVPPFDGNPAHYSISN